MATLTLSLSAPPNTRISSLLPIHSPSISLHHYSPKLSIQTRASSSSSSSSSYHYRYQYADRESDEEDDDDIEEPAVGDCLVFEDGIFDDPFLQQQEVEEEDGQLRKTKKKKKAQEVEPQTLVPDDWKRAVDEINITKKEKRKIAQELQYGQRLDRKKKASLPLRVNLEEYLKYKDEKLSQVKPLVLQNPNTFGVGVLRRRKFDDSGSAGDRVEPKNPRWAVYGRGLEDITEFFNAAKYEPAPRESSSEGKRTLFTKEEKALMNAKMPNLIVATSEKWLPLHTLAASGEFYLATTLLKYDVSINAVDLDGLTALHKAIVCKKQAITNFLLRESANPFVRDKDGATLMHYAVRTASSNAIKILLLYNVDINLQDNDGWTPLHLAVQGKRTDVVRLLLIKGADTTLRNKDGLTPLELCLYTGQDTRTYQLIKLLKKLPRPRNSVY